MSRRFTSMSSVLVRINIFLSFCTCLGVPWAGVAVGEEPPVSALVAFYDPATPRLIQTETLELLGNREADFACFGDGWLTRDRQLFSQDDGLWATRLRAELTLTVLEPRPLTLTLTISPRFSVKLPAQQVTVFWEGTPIGVCDFSTSRGWKRKDFAFLVPAEAQKPGRNRLTFSSFYAVNAVALKEGKEVRETAFRFDALKLTETSAAPPPEAPVSEGEALRQHGRSRLVFPVQLPEQGPLQFRVSPELPEAGTPARILLRRDTLEGPEERVVFDGAAGGENAPQELSADLSSLAGGIVEVIFDCGRVAPVQSVLWRKAEITGPLPPPPAPAAPPLAGWPETKNVVLVILDATRADALSCYGHIRPTTPFIDGLAAHGVLFEHCVAPETYTYASMSSLLSSLHTFQHSALVYPDVFRYRSLLLSRILGAAGVGTGCASQNPFVSPETGLTDGFTEFQGLYKASEQACHKITQSALAEAEKLKAGRFFLYVHYLPPHSPYSMAGSYLQTLGADPAGKIGLDSNAIRDACRGVTAAHVVDFDNLRCRYDENLRLGDALVEELVQGLRGLGLGAETTLIVTSDHGEEFGEHGWAGHGGPPYATQNRIPLVMTTLAEGGLGAGARHDETVTTLDLYPTILDLFGAAPAAHARGRSLISAPARTGEPDVQCFTGSLKTTQVHAFTFARYKLVLGRKADDRRVYDREADTGELCDLAGIRPVLTDWLEASARAWQARQEAEFGVLGIVPETEAPAAPGEAPLLEHSNELKALGYL